MTPQPSFLALPPRLHRSLHEHARAHRSNPTTSRDRDDGHRIEEASELDNAYFPLSGSSDLTGTDERTDSPVSTVVSGALERVIRRLESLPRPFLNLGIKTVASYHFFGALGIGLGLLLSTLLALRLGLPLTILALLLAAAAVLTYAYINVTLLLSGKDAGVFFRYLLAVLVGETVLLFILGQPILPFLDVLAIGLGAMLASVRIGCFMAGCCHGRPYRFGLSYGRMHAHNGFPRRLLHVRLLPVQLIDAAAIAAATGAGTAILIAGAPPGSALTSFLILLSAVRFIIEGYRGDAHRPYRAGCTEAQWTAFALIVAINVLEGAGVVPFYGWHAWIGGAGLVVVLYRMTRERLTTAPFLFAPAHLAELTGVFDLFRKNADLPAGVKKKVVVQTTSRALRFSGGVVCTSTHEYHHITMSSTSGTMNEAQARKLSRLIQSWYPEDKKSTLLAARAHTYHFVRVQSVDYLSRSSAD